MYNINSITQISSIWCFILWLDWDTLEMQRQMKVEMNSNCKKMEEFKNKQWYKKHHRTYSGCISWGRGWWISIKAYFMCRILFVTIWCMVDLWTIHRCTIIYPRSNGYPITLWYNFAWLWHMCGMAFKQLIYIEKNVMVHNMTWRTDSYSFCDIYALICVVICLVTYISPFRICCVVVLSSCAA